MFRIDLDNGHATIGYVAGKSKRVAKSIVRELNSQPSVDGSQAVPGLCSEEVIT